MAKLYKVSFYVEIETDEELSDSQIVDACERNTHFDVDYATIGEID